MHPRGPGRVLRAPCDRSAQCAHAPRPTIWESRLCLCPQDGLTPLFTAASCGCTGAVAALLGAGAAKEFKAQVSPECDLKRYHPCRRTPWGGQGVQSAGASLALSTVSRRLRAYMHGVVVHR